ncbi:MAG: hypothetical protein F6K31_07475 [Symploca sp. SIO2G7]|nr:hypothetical protein [Symploca sp. SIO2G7]
MSKVPVGFRLPENEYLTLLAFSRIEGTNLSAQLSAAVGKYVREKQSQFVDHNICPQK